MLNVFARTSIARSAAFKPQLFLPCSLSLTQQTNTAHLSSHNAPQNSPCIHPPTKPHINQKHNGLNQNPHLAPLALLPPIFSTPCSRSAHAANEAANESLHELDAFDPHNRFTIATPPPHPLAVSPAPAATQTPTTPRSKTARERARPLTMLLPSPPKLKRMPKRPQAAEPNKGKFLRMDSGEKWWQVGRKATEKKRPGEREKGDGGRNGGGPDAGGQDGFQRG
ncbi:hypothetical protein Q7P37_003645 [Cladosporium fusiforme]